MVDIFSIPPMLLVLIYTYIPDKQRCMDFVTFCCDEAQILIPIQQMSWIGINITEIQYILNRVTHTTISTISMFRSDCINSNVNGFRILERLQITSLSLNQCNMINDAMLVHLKQLPLRTLSMNCCTNITDVGLSHLTELPLSSLNLSHCAITDDGLLCLSKMPLKILKLSYCYITDNGIQHLTKLPLLSLNLRSIKNISKVGLLHLPQTLEILNISRNKGLKNEDLEGLILMNIHTLYIQGCLSLTYACLDYIGLLPLNTLIMTGNVLPTDFNKLHLKKTRPNLKIY